MRPGFLLVLLAGCDQVFLERRHDAAPVDEMRIADARIADARNDDAPTDAPADLVAYYSFEAAGPMIVDATLKHSGMVVHGPLNSINGQIGRAVAFPIREPFPHIVVPDSSDFDLAIGSIELWVRPSTYQDAVGILSRDNSGTSDGHLTLVHINGKFFVMRLQVGGESQGFFVCSNDPPLPDTWTHVVMNFGPPEAELWINGVKGNNAGATFDMFGQTGLTCSTPQSRAIKGNDDPFVFGALGAPSSPGNADRIIAPLAAGAIDELYIRRGRIDMP